MAAAQPRPFKDKIDSRSSNKYPRRRAKKTHADEPATAAGKELQPVRISVVLPTYKRPDLLNRCLEALVNQRLDPASYEIIVVDDGPSRETKEVVAQWITRVWGQGPVIGYIASKGPHGPAAARNQGWRLARGEIIAFTDDDTVPDHDWLRNSLQSFQGNIHAAWGRIIMPLNDEPTDFQLDAQGLERAEFATANCFCLKRVLDTINGFDERFRLPWREDADLYFRLLHYDTRVVYLPEAIVVHPVRSAPWGISVLQQKKIFFDALLFKKHPVLYREKIRATPRWDYYAIVAALFFCLLGLLFAMPALATTAGALWAALTARFGGYRLRHSSKAPLHRAEMIVTSALIPPIAVFWRLAGAIRFRVCFV